MSIVTLRPNGAGTYTEFEDLIGAATHWEAVDEADHDDATTYVGSDVANNRDTFALTACGLGGGDTINKITVKVWVRREGTNDDDFTIMIRSGSTDSNGTYVSGLTTTWVEKTDDWATDPDTSLAWTVAALDALEAGVKVYTGVDCTWVAVDVDYTSGAAGYPYSQVIIIG